MSPFPNHFETTDGHASRQLDLNLIQDNSRTEIWRSERINRLVDKQQPAT